MISKGYKFITWAAGSYNADIYMQKIEDRDFIHYKDLQNVKGFYDSEELPGIYFCDSLEELFIWLKEFMEWDKGFESVEILEIIPQGEVKTKHYPQWENRKSYVSDQIRARVLEERELPPEYGVLFDEYFG